MAILKAIECNYILTFDSGKCYRILVDLKANYGYICKELINLNDLVSLEGEIHSMFKVRERK